MALASTALTTTHTARRKDDFEIRPTERLAIAVNAMYVFKRPTLGCGPINTFVSGFLPLRMASTDVSQSAASNVLSLQLFLIVTFLPVMFVAAYVEEQGHKWKIMRQSGPCAMPCNGAKLAMGRTALPAAILWRTS